MSDALVEFRKRRESRVAAGGARRSLPTTRHGSRTSATRAGCHRYLEVLDTERQLFDAELGLVRIQRDELLAVVRLYRALGGGWKE